MNETSVLPDMQKQRIEKLETGIVLDQVGMRSIEVPVLLKQGEKIWQASAKATAYVNLIETSSRGIHMSRLYKDLQEALG